MAMTQSHVLIKIQLKILDPDYHQNPRGPYATFPSNFVEESWAVFA